MGLRAEVFHLEDAWSPERAASSAATLADRDVAGAAVLLHTGWDRWFGQPEYGRGAPFLTGEAAQWLIDAGAVLVGIDSVNIDDTESGGERPAHSLLLGAGRARRRAPHEPRLAAAARRALHGRAARRRGLRHLPGARVRRGAGLSRDSIAAATYLTRPGRAPSLQTSRGGVMREHIGVLWTALQDALHVGRLPASAPGGAIHVRAAAHRVAGGPARPLSNPAVARRSAPPPGVA